MNVNFLCRYPPQAFPSQKLFGDIGHEDFFILWGGLPEFIPKAQPKILLLVMGKLINNGNIKLTLSSAYHLSATVLSTLYINSFKWWFFVLHFRRSLRRWWADREATRLGKEVASISSKDWGKTKSSEYKKIGKILPLISDIISFKGNIFFNLPRKNLKHSLAYNHEGSCVGKNHQLNLVWKSCHSLFFMVITPFKCKSVWKCLQLKKFERFLKTEHSYWQETLWIYWMWENFHSHVTPH